MLNRVPQKNWFLNLLIIIELVSLFIASIISIVLKTAFNFDFYKKFYIENDSAQQLGISSNNLLSYTDNLLNYLKVGSPLDSTWYTKKDILHMIDVRNLYLYSYYFAVILWLVVIVITILILLLNRKLFYSTVLAMFNKVLLLFILIMVLIGIFITTNFNKFWIKFHEILFTNDLWLLSPSESNLIKMFPEEFFFQLVSNIVIYIFSCFLLLIIVKTLIKRYLKI